MVPRDTQVDGSGSLQPSRDHAPSGVKVGIQRPPNNDNKKEAVSTSEVARVKDPVYGPKLRGDDSHHPRSKAWSDAESFHTSDRISGSASSSTLCSGQQTADLQDNDKSKERNSSKERTSNKSSVPELPPGKSLDECNNGANIHQTQKPMHEGTLWDIIKGNEELEKIYKKFVPVPSPEKSPEDCSDGVDIHKTQEPADDLSYAACPAMKNVDEEFYREFGLEPPLGSSRRHGSGIRPNDANHVASINGTKSKDLNSVNGTNGVKDDHHINGDDHVKNTNYVGGINGTGTSSASGTNGVDVANRVKDDNHINGDNHGNDVNNVDDIKSTKTKDLNSVNGINKFNGVNGVNGANSVNGVNAVDSLTDVNGASGANGLTNVNGLTGIFGDNGVNGVKSDDHDNRLDSINGFQVKDTGAANGDSHVNGLETVNDFQVKDPDAANDSENQQKYSPSVKSIAPIFDRTLDGIAEMHRKQQSYSKDATPGQSPILRLKDVDQSPSQQ